MYARFGLNKNGKMPAWRCYGEFSESNSELACVNNMGEQTNDGCTDPIPDNKIYCTRSQQIEAIIGKGQRLLYNSKNTITDSIVYQ